jgi:hypothetical protein
VEPFIPVNSLQRDWCLLFLSLAVWALPSFAQPAPERSDELCASLKISASDSGRVFNAYKPGACMMSIDTGYNLFVDYNPPETLAVSLSVSPVLLNGDASAFWLRLSALDNLAHSALATDQKVVFDQLNKLAKKLAPAELDSECGTNHTCDASTARGSQGFSPHFSQTL